MRSVQRLSSHVIRKIETPVEEETRYKKYCTYKNRCLSPLQSGHLGTSHSSPSRHQLPCHIFLNLINSLKYLPFERWFQFWEKLEVTGHQIWAETPGWFHVSPKNSTQDMMHEQEHGHDEAAHHLLPTDAAFWIIWISFHGGMFKFNAKCDAGLLLCSLSHFECAGHTVHILTQCLRLPP